MNMRNSIIALLAFFMLASCEKEIDIDLNTTEPKVVIEGRITQGELARVNITKSVNFSDSNVFPSVSGANVKITDSQGNTEQLSEIRPGVYEGKTMRGTIGQTYTLTVQAEGKTYTASSTMPQLVKLEGVRTELNTFAPPGRDKDLLTVYPEYTDPVELGNNYRFIAAANDVVDRTIILSNDNIDNGLPNSRPLFTQDLEVRVGDKLSLEMWTMDRSTYDYFFTLSQIAGNGPGGGTTPTNPPNNLSGGALGYFSAHTLQKITLTVK
jgi:hypothetical protein